MAGERLTFKQMCARFDTTPRTLRYYEYIELLSPEKEGRTRFYTARDIARMTLILRGRRFGFSLEEIRQWLDLYEEKGTRVQMEDLIRHVDRQLKALRQQQTDLAESIVDLQKLRDDVARDLE